MRLFRSTDLDVHFDDRGGEAVLVAFAPYGYAGARGWAADFARKADVSLMGFVARTPHWYAADVMRPALPTVLQRLGRYRTRIGYGASMGGYGALKYGRALGLDAAVAFSPQATIDPASGIVPANLARYFQPALHQAMAIAPGEAAPRAYVLFDPCFAPDLQAWQAIEAAAPHATPIRLHHVTHQSVRVFADTERAAALIRACAAGDTGAALRLASQARRRAPIRAAGLANALIDRGRFELAGRVFAARADRLLPEDRAEFNFILGSAFNRARRLTHAKAAMELSLSDDPGRAAALCKMSEITLRLDDLPAARAWADRCAQLHPQDYRGFHQLALVGERLQDIGLAREAVDRALGLAPTRTNLIELRARLYRS